MEKRLATIWQDVLHIEQISIQDNFFELGGHSLLATRVVSRIRRKLNVELPLSEIFAYPTIAGLARVVDALCGSDTRVEVIPVAPRTGHMPLSFAQERLWFLDQLEPGKTSYNMPFAYRLAGELGVEALQSALNTLVQRHEILRTAIGNHEGKPYLSIEEHLDFHLAVENLHDLSTTERDEFIQRFSHKEIVEGFNLEQAPLIRARLLCCDTNDYILFITLHHIIFDGWSINIFLKELLTLYQQYTSGETVSLEPLKLQYADYASWLRLWLQGDNLSKQLDFWKQMRPGERIVDVG
jgi:acyl carrier protein